MEERLTFHFDKELEVPLVPKRLEQIRRLEEAWWARWAEDGFQLLCPRKKWHLQHRNLQAGDIVLIKYQQALGKDKFRLGKVEEAIPDIHGRVRTVLVSTRDKRKALRERKETCKAGLMELRLPVQRLVVLLPAGEAWSQGMPKPAEEATQ